LFEDILTVTVTSQAIEEAIEGIVEHLQEVCQPREVVFLNETPVRSRIGLECGIHTRSGQNLKARWIEIDGLAYRMDWLQPEKPRFFLDQREQHALVGSLCEGRSVLDGYAHSGAFALQAARAGATHVRAVDNAEACVKAIGAQAQKNGCFIEAVQADVLDDLAGLPPGAIDVIILDPPEVAEVEPGHVHHLHTQAFRQLPAGGLLATYCRAPGTSAAQFETIVARAAAEAGREARIFARTAQPFDFPVLLHLPESQVLKGFILQVE
jgi:23S rRNA (cytosine1962-C5)-methyltransferase